MCVTIVRQLYYLQEYTFYTGCNYFIIIITIIIIIVIIIIIINNNSNIIIVMVPNSLSVHISKRA